MSYKLLKDLPGACAGTEVMIFPDGEKGMFIVICNGGVIARVPNTEWHDWLAPVGKYMIFSKEKLELYKNQFSSCSWTTTSPPSKPKKIEPLDFPTMWEPGIANDKINELITAVNRLTQ